MNKNDCLYNIEAAGTGWGSDTVRERTEEQKGKGGSKLYTGRGSIRDVYTMCAKCQAGLSALKQSFLIVSCTIGANPLVKLES